MLLDGGPHHACDSFRHPLPLRLFDRELSSSLGREPVILEFAIAIGSNFPLGNDPFFSLQPVQRGVERTVLHLQEIIGGPLNVFADFVAVSWAKKKSSQNEHVQSSLEYVGALRWICWHGRDSTSGWNAMVDIRL